MLEAASIEPDSKYPVDGRSLMDLKRTRIFLEYAWGGHGRHWASIRTRNYQYVEYYDPDEPRRKRKRTVIFREYYDLKVDPWQLRNLLQGPSGDEELDLTALSRQLAKDRFCRQSTCP